MSILIIILIVVYGLVAAAATVAVYFALDDLTDGPGRLLALAGAAVLIGLTWPVTAVWLAVGRIARRVHPEPDPDPSWAAELRGLHNMRGPW